MIPAEHHPLDGDDLPLARVSEAIIAAHADAARRTLAARGAMDVAEALGLAS